MKIYLRKLCWFSRKHIPKQAHYVRFQALELLCNSICGGRTKKFGHPWPKWLNAGCLSVCVINCLVITCQWLIVASLNLPPQGTSRRGVVHCQSLVAYTALGFWSDIIHRSFIIYFQSNLVARICKVGVDGGLVQRFKQHHIVCKKQTVYPAASNSATSVCSAVTVYPIHTDKWIHLGKWRGVVTAYT